MRLRLFLVGAIVLIVFCIIAAASATGLCLGTTAFVWLAASLLSFLVDILVGGWGYASGEWGRG